MKEASLADNVKVATGGIRFFLGVDQDQDEEESSDEEDGVDIKKLRHQAGINKKTKKKARTLEKAVAVVKKVYCKILQRSMYFSSTRANITIPYRKSAKKINRIN